KTGQFHTRACREYANGKAGFVAGVHPRKAGTDFEGIPIFGTVKEAKERTGATVSVIYVPPAGAAEAIWAAVDADLDLVICITEGIPVRDMVVVRDRMRRNNKKTLLLGPNGPGVITPAELTIGMMPGHIHMKGRVGVVSRSGTLTYEAVAQLTALGLGQSTAVGIGGDPVNGLKHVDVLRMFNDDPETDDAIMICQIGGTEVAYVALLFKDNMKKLDMAHTDIVLLIICNDDTTTAVVIMYGGIGGTDEEEATRWVKDKMKKPVVGFIAGVTAPPGKRMGHAGAIISGGKGTAQEKLEVMEACG